jgi:hypothetical protein
MSTSGRAELEGNAAVVQGSVAQSLEQVREILFGPQHRDFARRLARTDANVAARAEELRNEMRRRLDVLEAHIRKESEALSASIDSQRSAQAEALNKVARESRESIGLLEQRVQKLEELMARVPRDFRQQLLDQAKSFIDEVQRTRDELSTTVDRALVAAWSETPEMEAPAQSTPGEEGRGEPWERPSEAA